MIMENIVRNGNDDCFVGWSGAKGRMNIATDAISRNPVAIATGASEGEVA